MSFWSSFQSLYARYLLLVESGAEDPRCGEWDRLMRSYQCRIPTADPDDEQWWTPMQKVFDLEEQEE